MDQWRPTPPRTLADVLEQIRKWHAYLGWRRIIWGALLSVAVIAGGMWLIHSPKPPVEQRLPIAVASTSVAQHDTITVHLVGAVRKPGVYKVADGSRLFEVVYLAGGFAHEADQAGVNLAAIVADGEQVFVPAVGEPRPAGLAGSASRTSSGKVSINRGTSSDLEQLPGIGPTIAAAIVAYRESNGPFAAVDDLLRVTGIGDAKLSAIRELISL